MAYVPGFTNDILISYAHLDNRQGWVDAFHTRLCDRLAQIDVNVTIWRDAKLGGMDLFSDEIFAQLKSTALLVSIVSPRGIKSNWCQDERQKFEQFAETNGGLRIGNHLRAVKVVKTPVAGDAHRQLWGTLGFEFYQRNEQTAKFREFDLSGHEFSEKLDDMAQDIKQILDQMRARPAPQPRKPSIYVAATSSDLEEQHRAVTQQIQDWGYTVMPAAPLPFKSGFRAAVESIVADCLLSIHLVSDQRGAIPEDEERSVVALQYEIAEARQVERVVWIQPDHQPAPSVRQSLDQGPQKGVERLEGRNLEDLKDVIELKLKRLSGELPAPKPGGKKLNIYLVCDRKDHPFDNAAIDAEQVRELKAYLDKEGFVVWLPPVNVPEEKLRKKDHWDTLKQSHAVLLYWGMADEVWVRRNLRELSNARTRRGSRQLLAEAIYFGRPPGNEKSQYNNHLDMAIVQAGPFRPEALNEFLKRLRHDKDKEEASV